MGIKTTGDGIGSQVSKRNYKYRNLTGATAIDITEDIIYFRAFIIGFFNPPISIHFHLLWFDNCIIWYILHFGKTRPFRTLPFILFCLCSGYRSTIKDDGLESLLGIW